jgi:hypothetical protein
MVGLCLCGSAIFSCPTVHGIELLFLAEHPLVSFYHFRHFEVQGPTVCIVTCISGIWEVDAR